MNVLPELKGVLLELRGVLGRGGAGTLGHRGSQSTRNLLTQQLTAALLRPIAIGVLCSLGLGSKLKAGCGHFCASVNWIREITGVCGWRSTGSYGDSRKLPGNYESQGLDFKHRLAALVFRYNIPKALVVNGDHTGVTVKVACLVAPCMWLLVTSESKSNAALPDYPSVGKPPAERQRTVAP